MTNTKADSLGYMMERGARPSRQVCFVHIAAHRSAGHGYLVRAQKAHIVSELIVAAMLTVRHQVYEARTLLSDRKSFALHLIHPASWHKPHHLPRVTHSVTDVEQYVDM